MIDAEGLKPEAGPKTRIVPRSVIVKKRVQLGGALKNQDGPAGRRQRGYVSRTGTF